MFGNGAGIGGIQLIIKRVKIVPTQKVLRLALAELFEVARGTMNRSACVVLNVAATANLSKTAA